ADYDYPGRVAIVRHEPALYSVYGHLDPDLAVTTGDAVERGATLGRILARPDEVDRSHLHFEIRTFFTTDRVNDASPEHGFTCGPNCPPGPGYWPRWAEHPSTLGWRNPTHAIARRGFPGGLTGTEAWVIVTSIPSSPAAGLWSAPPWREGSAQIGELDLTPSRRYRLRQISAGADDSTGRNAAAYRLWYRLEIDGQEPAWVQAAVPSASERNADGTPAAVLLDLLPA
ncbi:MAG: M23 family metallopeptidase, partial [Thermomicrobiales bacterium]|nr:M23 family metallopeptidase [Thermomicrobiales bacterium]